MPLKKIIYITYYPASEKTRRDWFMNDLVAHGAEVEFWDASAIWGYPQNPGGGRTNISIPISSFQELERRIALPENNSAIFVVIANYEARFQNLFRLLTKNRCTTCVFEWGHQPIRPVGALEKLRGLALNPAKLRAAVCNKLVVSASMRFGWVKPFDLVFAAGQSASRTHPKAGRIVPINMCDYENFQAAIRGGKRLIEGRYGLFMDSNHALNPNRPFVGLPPMDAERYFASLNRFFGLMEKKFGFPVVVSLHHSSAYGAERFEGRRTLKDSTPALAKNAEFVVCHQSTSMGYGVLAGKPILFIYTDEIARVTPDYVRDMRAPSDYLNMPLINIDTAASSNEIMLAKVDPRRYDAYTFDFLTSRQSMGRLTKDIVIEEFARLSS